MKTLQIHSDSEGAKSLLNYVGVKRIHKGWYTITYLGISLDCSTIGSAKRNHKGLFNV